MLRALEGCHACDEDEAHFEGLDGEILRTIADGECESRIEVKRVLDPYNPVAFLTPPSELALAAVASEPIDAGEPIALYAGDLLSEEEEAAASMYVYELDPEELARRGYSPPAGSRFGPCLRVDASRQRLLVPWSKFRLVRGPRLVPDAPPLDSGVGGARGGRRARGGGRRGAVRPRLLPPRRRAALRFASAPARGLPPRQGPVSHLKCRYRAR